MKDLIGKKIFHPDLGIGIIKATHGADPYLPQFNSYPYEARFGNRIYIYSADDAILAVKKFEELTLLERIVFGVE